jgi:hypothetical protein
MTREQNVAALAGAIRKLIEALIAQDQRIIGVHETVTAAQADLRDALQAALSGVKERAHD